MTFFRHTPCASVEVYVTSAVAVAPVVVMMPFAAAAAVIVVVVMFLAAAFAGAAANAVWGAAGAAMVVATTLPPRRRLLFLQAGFASEVDHIPKCRIPLPCPLHKISKLFRHSVHLRAIATSCRQIEQVPPEGIPPQIRAMRTVNRQPTAVLTWHLSLLLRLLLLASSLLLRLLLPPPLPLALLVAPFWLRDRLAVLCVAAASKHLWRQQWEHIAYATLECRASTTDLKLSQETGRALIDTWNPPCMRRVRGQSLVSTLALHPFTAPTPIILKLTQAVAARLFGPID